MKGYTWSCKKKVYIYLGESITFDDIQRRFCVSICLVVVCEIYNVMVVVRSFSPPIVCQSKNTLAYNIITRTKFIVRNTGRINCSSCNTGRINCSSCIAETTENHFCWCLCDLFGSVRAVQA